MTVLCLRGSVTETLPRFTLVSVPSQRSSTVQSAAFRASANVGVAVASVGTSELRTLPNFSAPDPLVTASDLVVAFEAAVERALDQLRRTDELTLTATREVGRARLPSTVIGLLFHGAEHTQRHAGQALTTKRMSSDS